MEYFGLGGKCLLFCLELFDAADEKLPEPADILELFVVVAIFGLDF